MTGKGALGGGIVAITLVLGVVYLIHSTKAKAKAEKVAMAQAAAEYARIHPPAPNVPPEYPTSGSGHTTQATPIKAWLDPMKTFLRPSRAARYVFVEDPEMVFDETYTEGLESNSTPHRKQWLAMPAGKYLVYPLGADKIYFRWWQ